MHELRNLERKWPPRCLSVVRSLHEGGEEVLTVFQSPKSQWKTLHTTNVIERLHEEFRRRVKTQGSLPTEDATLGLLFGLLAGGQIRLGCVNGWRSDPGRAPARPAVGSMTHRTEALGPCRALQTNMLSEGPDAHAAKPSVSKVRRSSRWRF